MYDNCKHLQGGGNGVTLTVISCTQCDADREVAIRQWASTQPWYVRLDEWQHRRSFSGQLWWHRIWRPFCNFVDWTYHR